MSILLPSMIKETALEYTHTDFHLPPVIHTTVDFLQDLNLFLYYRTYKITNYINPKTALVTGAILQSGGWWLGISEIFKAALYIKCTLDLAERYENLNEAYKDLYQAIHCVYPVYRAVDWNLKDQEAPSFAIWWQTTVKHYQEQIVKVIVCACRLFMEIFKLSLFLRDLFLLTQNDPTIEFYGYSELVDNLISQREKLANNGKLLVEQLTSHKTLGNRLLEKLGMSATIEKLIIDMDNQEGRGWHFIREQFEGFKEDFRSTIERNEIDLAEGRYKPSILPKSQIIAYLLVQNEVDEFFRKQAEERARNTPLPENSIKIDSWSNDLTGTLNRITHVTCTLIKQRG